MTDTIPIVSISFDGQLEYSSFLYNGPNDCDSVTAAVNAEYPGKTFSCVEQYNSTPPTYIVTEIKGEFNEYDGEQETEQVNRNGNEYDSGYESNGSNRYDNEYGREQETEQVNRNDNGHDSGYESDGPVRPGRTLRRATRRIRR
ncbi:hypothetical protein H4S00_003728, partial [Coemansia sp. D1744]